MKYLVASDIHGSALGAKIIAEKFQKTKCDRILLLGDLLYHGPRNPFPDEYDPKQVYEILNSLADKIIAVKGNCDAEVDQMVLNFPLHDSVGIDLGKNIVFCTHGQHISANNPKKFVEGTVVLYGHYHKISREVIDGIPYINIGSIALPKENSKKCYGILEKDGIRIFDTEDTLLNEYKF